MESTTHDQFMITICMTAGFPLCVESALSQIFEEDDAGRKLRIALSSGDPLRISSPEALALVYEKFSKSFGAKFSDKALRMLNLWSMGRMESLPCQSCPVYRKQREVR